MRILQLSVGAAIFTTAVASPLPNEQGGSQMSGQPLANDKYHVLSRRSTPEAGTELYPAPFSDNQALPEVRRPPDADPHPHQYEQELFEARRKGGSNLDPVDTFHYYVGWLRDCQANELQKNPGVSYELIESWCSENYFQLKTSRGGRPPLEHKAKKRDYAKIFPDGMPSLGNKGRSQQQAKGAKPNTFQQSFSNVLSYFKESRPRMLNPGGPRMLTPPSRLVPGLF